MLSRTKGGPLVIYGLLVLLAASMLFPFYWMAITSLKGKADVFSTEPKLLPGRQLAERVIDHYRIDLRLLIFDATNFDTFIDSRTVSALAQRGHAKSKRADLRILGLALLVSTDYHVPLLSHPYPGNQNDAAMFSSLIETLISRCKQLAQDCEDVTLVFDGGNTSRANIEALQAGPYHFVTSLTVTQHEDLLAVPAGRFHAFADPRLAGVTAYRSAKEIWGYEEEDQAAANLWGHGLGLAQYDPPVISRIWSLDHPVEIRPGMTFALETQHGILHKFGVRLEEMLYVTDTGIEMVSTYKSHEIIVVD